MLSFLKNLFFTMRDILILTVGLLAYKLNSGLPYYKRTSLKTNIALVNIFCRTEGKSNDFINAIISLFDKPISFPNTDGVLGNLSKENIANITKELDINGYYIFPNKLPEHLCNELLKLASTEKFELSLSDEDIENGKLEAKFDYYDRKNSKATRYTLNNQTCVNNAHIQNIFSDFSILSIAQSYLRSSPKIDILGLWWSTAFAKKPQKQSAEFFHFDMDRPKWLKFFIYLTDVTPNSGPHQFVRGSHLTGNIPRQILKQGYARITDEEVHELYNQNDIIKFTAPKGTIIAEDTRGLHKATKILKDDRLILQLQYSNTLFGTMTSPAQLTKLSNKNLQYIYKHHSNLLALYLPHNKNNTFSLNLAEEYDK